MSKKFLLLLIYVCATINSFSQSLAINDTIPLIINEQNTIYVKAVFNQRDTLNLNFDTGTTDLVLINDVLQHKLNSEVKLYNTYYNLRIGKRDYKTLVFDAQLSGYGTEGRFGWDFFKEQVVELNYDRELMIIHNQTPEYVLEDDAYTTLDIKYFLTVFAVESTIIQDGIQNTDSFLFDTGYNRTAMLDNDLMKESGFPFEKMKVIKKVILRGAQGNEVPVITSNLQDLKIGDYVLKDVPVQQITSHKPLNGHNIHILGNEILNRFNIFLDFQKHKVYLNPNKFYDMEYIEKM